MKLRIPSHHGRSYGLRSVELGHAFRVIFPLQKGLTFLRFLEQQLAQKTIGIQSEEENVTGEVLTSSALKNR